MRCTTCGDVATAMRVLARAEGEAICEDPCGQRSNVALDFVPLAREGDVVLVHFGVALARIQEGALNEIR